MKYLVFVCLIALPFLLAGMIHAVLTLKDKKGFGPIPYCIAMGILLVIIWIGTF